VGAKLASTVKDAGSRTPYKVPTVTIPASGRVAVTVRCAEGWWYRPMPTGTPQPSDGDGGITYAWGDVTTYEPASVWGIDSSHQPELGYLSYLLFRDPWDLHTIQADAMCSANTYPQFLEGQARQVAWDYAHAVEAWAATPAVAPGWLLPKSTLAKWVQVIQRWLISRVIDQPGAGGQPELATVFHSIYAAKPVGPQTAKLCDGKITATGPMIQSWQDAFFCQSAALAVILNPGDADAQKLLAYSVRSVADRYDDTGWPKGVKTPYVTRVGDGTRMYRSWAEAWAGNAPMIQVDAKRCPLDPPPPPPQEQNITASNSDYPTGDFAALSLAVQAGLTQYRPQRDFIGAACRRVSVPFARGYAET
jgi:hypothetical protein